MSDYTELIEFIKNSIIELNRQNIKPNTLFIDYKDLLTLKDNSKILSVAKAPGELDKVLGLDVIFIGYGTTCVAKRAILNVRSKNEWSYWPSNK